MAMQGASTRFKGCAQGEATLFRLWGRSYDADSQFYRTDITASRIQENPVTSMTRESHEIRVFFARQLWLLPGSVGFRMASLHRFPDGEQAADATTWPVVAVAVVE